MGSLVGFRPSASIRQVSHFHAGVVLALSLSLSRSSCLVATRYLPSGDHIGLPLLSEILPGLLLPPVSQFQMPAPKRLKTRVWLSGETRPSCPPSAIFCHFPVAGSMAMTRLCWVFC